MTKPPSESDQGGLSRRAVLGAAGAGAAGLGGTALLPGTAWADPGLAGPALWSQPGRAGAPDVHGLHLQFGADAAREVVVSWSTPTSVARPRVLFGTASDGYGHDVAARTVTYRDGQSGNEVFIHHARLSRLRPNTEYAYAAVHEAARRRRASSARPRAGGRRSPSPASATRARRPSASSTPRRPA
jgi:hypothetical protein